MDERQLAELFRDAADGGPSARFGHDDVITASRRATSRRRMVLAGGVSLSITVLVGSIVVGGGFFRDTDRGADSAATAGSAQEQSSGPLVLQDEGDRTAAPPGQLDTPSTAADDRSVTEGPAEQGRATSGKVVPWPGLRNDDARAGCGPVDRELADGLVSEFPVATGASLAGVQPFPVPDGCPPEARAAALPVDGGALYIVLAPVRGDGPADQYVARDGDNALGFSVYTPRGQVLVVLAVPADAEGDPPFAANVEAIATAIAQRY